ncbi:Nickel transport system permease protein NikB [Corynebacterium kalinowskii]|uniref:Nickel transport system permease protein NikB n=2 Tax=Corynebacterium kalinowskii TaxID=2675216 RepID=A0A6B8VBK9_9CORY|nr:Nickel transport system permease protein NikB [Corynebacterium kalinowskii]
MVEPRGVEAVTSRPNLAGLGRMIALRLLAIAATVFGVTFAIFGLSAASPLDPLAYQLGARYGQYTEAERAELAVSLGLDRPWWQQFLNWWSAVFQGDLGYSRIYRKPVADVVAERLPWTALLSGFGLALMLVAVVALALWAARKPRGLIARGMDGFGVLLAATPSFVYALGVIAVFGVALHAIPLGGAAPPGVAPTLAGVGPYVVAPGMVLALSLASWPLLATVEATREAASSPAVLSARLRGVPESQVVLRHVLPVSLLPLVTVVGARLGELVVGAVIVESVFSWPGLAQATVEAAVATDFPLLAFVTAATTVLVMLGSLLSDIAYLLLDPRVSDV